MIDNRVSLLNIRLLNNRLLNNRLLNRLETRLEVYIE